MEWVKEGENVYKSSGIFGAMMGKHSPWWISTEHLAGLHLSGTIRAAYTWMY